MKWALRSVAIFAAVLLSCGAVEAQTLDWSGPYLGVDIGAVWANQSVLSQGSVGLLIGINGNLHSSRIVGGTFGGYNWNVAPNWIFGGEADFEGTTINDSTQAPNTFGIPGGTRWKRSVSWLSSLRARIGYTVRPDLLLYGTAGGALAKENFNASNNLFGCPGAGCTTVNFGQLKAGFAMGAGFDWALSPNLLVRAQYLYGLLPVRLTAA